VSKDLLIEKNWQDVHREHLAKSPQCERSAEAKVVQTECWMTDVVKTIAGLQMWMVKKSA
jgi:hypothetical protein